MQDKALHIVASLPRKQLMVTVIWWNKVSLEVLRDEPFLLIESKLDITAMQPEDSAPVVATGQCLDDILLVFNSTKHVNGCVLPMLLIS